MNQFLAKLFLLPVVALTGGCAGGVGVTAIPEVWDRASDPQALFHMEVQIKQAIYCQLRYAVTEIRKLNQPIRASGSVQRPGSKVISTVEDMYLPDSWGVLIQLSLQTDEKSALAPSVAFKDPIDNALTGFRIGQASLAQSYQLGVGGALSSQNTRNNKYNFFYAVRDLSLPISAGSVCVSPPKFIGETKSNSSPFVDASNLDIEEWLLSAVKVLEYRRSSRKSEDGIGPPLGSTSGPTQSDSSTYSNKFTIVSSANVAPSWNLIKVGTPTSPLFDLSRTRVHEIIMTIGPGALERSTTPFGKPTVTLGPSNAVINSQLASQIGSAVANALR